MGDNNSSSSSSSRSVSANRTNVLTAVAFYWAVSISLVFLNKFSMSEVDAPIFITWTQLVLAVVGCKVLASMKPTTPSLEFFPEFNVNWGIAIRVLPLTATFVGMITFNNLCLKFVPVSFYQVARSLTIVFNVLFTYCLMNQKTTLQALCAVAAVFVGYVVGSSAEVSLSELSVMGSLYGILSSLFVSLYAINVKKVFPVVDNNKWTLMIYNNVIASCMMPPLIIVFGEIPVLLNSSIFYTLGFWFKCIFLTGIFGFLINIATYAQIQATSPLTHNISGTAKAGVQTLMALMFLKEPISSEGVLGLLLVLGGSLAYSYIRDREMNAGKLATTSYEPVNKRDGPWKPADVELGSSRSSSRS